MTSNPFRPLRSLVLGAALVLSQAGAGSAQGAAVIVTGPPELTDGLLPATLEAYAARREYGLKREFRGDGGFDLMLVPPAEPAGGVRFRVVSAPSVIARQSVGQGQAAFALARGPISDGPGFVLGEDAMVAVVSRSNMLSAITPEVLTAILRGEVVSWADLGGDDRPINVYLVAGETDQARLVDYYFLHGAMPSPNAVFVATDDELTDAVSLDPDGIGVAGFSNLGNTRALPLAGACQIAVAPNRAAIRNEDYPLSFAVTLIEGNAELPPMVGDFLAFLRSGDAQAAITQTGIVGVELEGRPLEAQGRRLVNAIKLGGTEVPAADLQRLAQTLDGQERLSVTFRFEPGATTLDAGSLKWVERLAEALKSGQWDGRAFTFIGFTDGVGAPEQNLGIGMGRAEAVVAAVREAAGDLEAQGITFAADSFGETMPIACDDSEWGRVINRRVEVWVR